MRGSRSTRVVALGLGMIMAGALSLVAVVPAQAVDGDITVYTSDIALTATPYAGWHVDSGSFSLTATGLEVQPSSSVINGYTVDEQRTADALKYSLSIGELSWTSTAGSAPAFFQIPFSFNGGSTILSPVTSSSGTNTTLLSDMWSTSADIGSSYAANDTAPIGDLLDALTLQTNAQVLGFGVAATAATSIVTRVAFMAEGFVFAPGSRLVPGTVTITGTPTVGSVLTVTTAGWPTGATFSYSWSSFVPFAFGDTVGTDSASYTVAASDIGRLIGVTVTASLTGSAPASVTADPTATVATAVKPAAAAPVADSTGLAAYLSSNSVTPFTQTSTGLPAGSIPSDSAQTATLTWSDPDSFVDAYVYSAPTFAGTFPVVNGQVQITLSSAVLSGLGAGAHTLVVTGQSSGAIYAVNLDVAASLAATGAADSAVPLTAGALLLLLGAALIFVKRRLHA